MSTPINDGGPAFPCPHPSAPEMGMTLRDWFAGKVLPAAAADAEDFNDLMRKSGVETRLTCENVAAISYAYADAMLAERLKGTT